MRRSTDTEVWYIGTKSVQSEFSDSDTDATPSLDKEFDGPWLSTTKRSQPSHVQMRPLHHASWH
jgi:hypothetical protein